MDKKYKELSERLKTKKNEGGNFRTYEEIQKDIKKTDNDPQEQLEKQEKKKAFKLNVNRDFVPMLISRVLPLIIIIVIIVAVVFALTNKDGFAVSRNGEVVAHVKVKQLTADEIYQTLTAKAQEIEGNDVEIADQIAVEPIKVKSKLEKNNEELINELMEGLDYKIKAAEISVNGKPVGTVRNQAEAKAIFDKLFQKFVIDPTNSSSKFVEDVQSIDKFVTKGEIKPAEEILAEMEKTETISEVYEVKQGDILSGIASSHEMTMAELKDANPDMDFNAVLKIGQKINIITKKPFVSVETVETKIESSEIPRKVIEQDDPELGSGQKRIIQQGKDGLKEVTTTITMINGVITNTSEPVEKIVTEPEDQIISIGSGS